MVVRILLIFSIAEAALAAPAVVRQIHLDQAKAASEKRAPGSVNGETGDFSTDMSRLLPPGVPSSSAVEDRITTFASGASSSRMPPHEPGSWAWWFDNADMGPLPGGPEPPPKWPPPPGRIRPKIKPTKPVPPDIPAWLNDAKDHAHLSRPGGPETPPEWPTSPRPLPPPPPPPTPPPTPPHQGPASLAAPEADRLFTNSLTHKILAYSAVAAIVGGTAGLAYGIHQWNKRPYVSPRSPLSPADI